MSYDFTSEITRPPNSKVAMANFHSQSHSNSAAFLCGAEKNSKSAALVHKTSLEELRKATSSHLAAQFGTGICEELGGREKLTKFLSSVPAPIHAII